MYFHFVFPLNFKFTVCSSATENDGNLPYGTTISTATIIATDPDGEVVTSSLVSNQASVSDYVVSCKISYLEGATEGFYKLTVVLTLNTGYVDEFDFKKLLVKDC